MQTRRFHLEQRSRSFTVTLLLAAALLNIDTAAGRPDVRQSPFSLDLQPPLAEATPTDFERSIDSYGNPIDALRPIDTPDGRKVISAQGVQFEIPNYASGITEIRKPADDLLPPHIGELTTTTTTTKKRTTTTTASGTAAAVAAATDENSASGATTTTKASNIYKQTHKRNTSTTNSTTSLRFTRTTPTPTPTQTSTPTCTTPPYVVPPLTPSNSNHAKRDSTSGEQYVIVPASPKHAPPTFTLLTLNPKAPPNAFAASSKQNRSKSIDDSIDASTYSTPNPNPSTQLDAIAVADYSDSTTDSYAPAPATSLTPPPNNNHESSPSDPHTPEVSVEVEQAELVNVQQQEESAQEPQLLGGTLPDYLLELQQQDKNIGGPVPWTPAPDGAPLSVIAWDLLPPLEPQIITEQQPTKHVVGVQQPGSQNIRVSLTSGQGLSPQAPAPLTSGQVAVVTLGQDGPAAHGTNAHVGGSTPANDGRFPNRNRGTAHYSTTPTTTPRPRSTTTTTTTPKPTTTTTRRTTTPTTTRATTTTTRTTTTTTPKPPRSTTPLDPSTFYKLDNAEEYAYTLPPWLQEVTDPDLDVAVTFVVPTDNDQYNHSLSDDLEPPFEPFVDLHNLQLTPPPTSERPSTTSTTRVTTTRATTIRAPTTTTTRRPSVIAPVTARTTQAPTIFKAQTTQPKRQPEILITSTTQKPTDPTKTTTAAVQVDPNPFDSSTLPPWLRDFDYPDVGPGVPYNPDNFKDTGDISGQKAGGSKPNDFQPHGFAINPTTRSQSTTTQPPQTPPPPSTTATPTTTTAASADNDNSAFPSKVTLTLPGNIDGTELNTAEPPLMLIPPSAVLVDNENQPKLQPTSFNSRSGTSNQQTTTNSITHFPERFDTPSSSSSAPGQDVALQPNQQQFPPFNTSPVSQPDSQKVEYSKSDDGKVISTPVNTQRKDTQGSTSAFLPTPTTSQPPTPPPAASNTGKYTGGFGAPPGLLRPQSASKPDIYVAGDEHEFSNNVNKINRGQQRPAAQGAGSNGGRYTGGFGAPSGVLSPQNAPRPFQQAQQAQPQPTRSQAYPQLAAAASSQVKNQSNRFGGPPGILVPFDNVQRTGGQ